MQRKGPESTASDALIYAYYADGHTATGFATADIMANAAVITRWGKRRYFMFWGLYITGICQFIIAGVYKASLGAESTGRVRKAASTIVHRITNTE